jgi:hypothetical protein
VAPVDQEKRERIVNLAAYQGNKFIKELLREKKLPIGTTEKEFRTNIRESLDKGNLSEQEIEEWLDRVEGWGDQQAYVFRAKVGKTKISQYKDLAQFEQILKANKKEKLLNRSHVELMPQTRKLTLIQHSAQGIRFVWHESLQWKRRLEDKNYDEYDEELQTRVFYQAFLEQWGRGVTSFAWRFDLALAAVFIPRRASEDYEMERDQILSTVGEAIEPLREWPMLPIDKAIFALDDKGNKEHPIDPKTRIIRSTKTNFETAGGVVVIESTRKDVGLQDNAILQSVRRVITPNSGFSGRRGDFYIRPRSKEQELHAILYGPQKRIAFPRQMSENVVWDFIKQIADLT